MKIRVEYFKGEEPIKWNKIQDYVPGCRVRTFEARLNGRKATIYHSVAGETTLCLGRVRWKWTGKFRVLRYAMRVGEIMLENPPLVEG